MTSGRWGLHGSRVKCGIREYSFLLSWDLHRLTGGEPGPELVSTWDAERALEMNASDAAYFGGSVIEKLYFAVTRRFDLPSLSPGDLDALMLSTVLDAVRSGELVAFEVEWSAPPQYSRAPEPPAEQPAEERPPATFDVQVVLDVDGSPVGQLSLGVKEPASDEFRSLRTDGDGRIHIGHTVRGTGDVRGDVKGARLDQSAVVVGWGATRIEDDGAPPTGEAQPVRYLVKLEEYRVQDGDTPESVATRARMSWPDLAFFNWGTRMPEEISRRLASEVGCTKKGANGNSFVFSNDDRPGIIHIPRPFSEEGLVTGKMNVMRVQPLRRTGRIRIRLGIDPRQATVRHQRFRLFSEDGAFEQEKGVEDDLLKGDECLDFEFTECPVDRSFSLEIVQAGTEPVRVFDGASFEELHDNHEEEGARA